MRKKVLVISGLFALAGTIAVAAVLGTAGIGKAASPNICLTPSTTNASCVAQLTAPHVLTAGQDAVSVTRFTNESGIGGSSATHVVLSATFLVGTVATPVTVKGVTLFVNGSPVSTASCSPASLATPPTSVATVSCPVGTIAGDSSAKLVVRFSASSARTVAGSASYGEGGNDSATPRPNGTKNDLQTSRDSFTIAGTSAQGNCFDTSLATLSGSTATQVTTASIGAVDPSLDLPCTPGGAGVDTVGTRPTGFVPIWFTDFLTVNNGGFATVTLDALFNVPKGFVLRELTGLNPSDAASWTAVPACNGSGLPPSGDSCIFETSSLPKGGVRWILHAFGTLFDSKYAG
jgi:hypothetical protein